MSANITITDAIGNYDSVSNTTDVLVLFQNPTYGWGRFIIFDNGNSNNIGSSTPVCYNATKYSLSDIIVLRFSGQSSNSKVDVTPAVCTSGENCAVSPPTCSIDSGTPTNGIVISKLDSTPPADVTNISVTPGDGQLSFLWNIVTSNIFCYQVILKDSSGTTVASGYLLPDKTGATFTGLTNDTVYTLNVHSESVSEILSSGVSISGTPAISPTLASISLSPATVTVGTGSTQQFTATCKDLNGNPISPCPTLTWDTTDHNLGTVNSSGLFTAGTTQGTVTVKATSGTIVGNATVTITTASTLTTISLSPTSATVAINGTQQFSATCKDQNSNSMTCPTLTWDTTDHAVGTVNSSGLFTAGSTQGTVTVKATGGTIVGSSVVTITTTSPAPVPAPVSGCLYTNTTALAALTATITTLLLTKVKISVK